MTESSENPQTPIEDPVAHPPHDPYPRIILVCFGIFIVLIIFIFGVIAFDLTQGTNRRLVNPPNAAPAPAPVTPAATEGNTPGE